MWNKILNPHKEALGYALERILNEPNFDNEFTFKFNGEVVSVFIYLLSLAKTPKIQIIEAAKNGV